MFIAEKGPGLAQTSNTVLSPPAGAKPGGQDPAGRVNVQRASSMRSVSKHCNFERQKPELPCGPHLAKSRTGPPSCDEHCRRNTVFQKDAGLHSMMRSARYSLRGLQSGQSFRDELSLSMRPLKGGRAVCHGEATMRHSQAQG